MARIVGIDVTRGLAVLGMFTAHVGAVAPEFWSTTGWLQVADGRSAAAFALLAGVSAALLSGGSLPAAALGRARARIAVRAVLVGLLGLVLVLLGTPVVIILPGYAVMFLAVTVALGWSRPTLLAAAAAVLLVGPPLVQAARRAGLPERSYLMDLLAGPYYPAGVWVAYLLVGLAVGRTDLSGPATRRTLLLVGGGCAIVGYGAAALAMRTVDSPSVRALLTAEPHTDTGPEVLGNTGVALAVLAVCLVAAERAPHLVAPLAATGALALTVYSTQIVALAIFGPGVVRRPSDNALLATFVVVTLVATTLWRSVWGRGPLERLLHEASTRTADALVAPVPPVAPVLAAPGGSAPPPGDTGG